MEITHFLTFFKTYRKIYENFTVKKIDLSSKYQLAPVPLDFYCLVEGGTGAGGGGLILIICLMSFMILKIIWQLLFFFFLARERMGVRSKPTWVRPIEIWKRMYISAETLYKTLSCSEQSSWKHSLVDLWSSLIQKQLCYGRRYIREFKQNSRGRRRATSAKQ